MSRVSPSNHWGRQPLLRRDAGPFGDLLDTATVERLLTDLGRRPTFRVVRAGTTIPTSEYTRRARVGGVVIDDVADVDRILALVAGGATIVLQGLQRTWPPLADVLRRSRPDGQPPRPGQRLPQPRTRPGSTRIATGTTSSSSSCEGDKCWDVEGLGEVRLGEGDVLYLPAGTRHAAWSLDDYSLHLTIGIVATTHRRLIHRIVDRLDAEIDAPLPFGYARAERGGSLDDELARVVGLVAESLAKLDVGDVARKQIDRERRRSTRILGRLAATVDPRAIDDGTVLRRRDGMDIDVGSGENGEELTLSFAGRRLHLPASPPQPSRW